MFLTKEASLCRTSLTHIDRHKQPGAGANKFEPLFGSCNSETSSSTKEGRLSTFDGMFICNFDIDGFSSHWIFEAAVELPATIETQASEIVLVRPPSLLEQPPFELPLLVLTL